MQEKLKAEVLLAYRELCRHGLDNHAGGIVSAIDRESGLIVMKSASEAFVVDLQGNVVEGYHTPSADIHTHIAIYQAFPKLGGIVQPCASFAAFFAQEGMHIPVFSPMHNTFFHHEIPCVASAVEIGTAFKKQSIDPLKMPAALVLSRSAYAWGPTAIDAVANAAALEKTASLAYRAMQLDPVTTRYNRKPVC